MVTSERHFKEIARLKRKLSGKLLFFIIIQEGLRDLYPGNQEYFGLDRLPRHLFCRSEFLHNTLKRSYQMHVMCITSKLCQFKSFSVLVKPVHNTILDC